MTTQRYMYMNSTRSSHAVEKVAYRMEGETRYFNACLCGRAPDAYPDWQLSFQPTKKVCKSCQATIEWRNQVMQRQYRTLARIFSRKGKPWSIPAGTVSSAITFEQRTFVVHFKGFGETRFSLQHVESRPNVFECIVDPTQPVLEPLPLFETA